MMLTGKADASQVNKQGATSQKQLKYEDLLILFNSKPMSKTIWVARKLDSERQRPNEREALRDKNVVSVLSD